MPHVHSTTNPVRHVHICDNCKIEFLLKRKNLNHYSFCSKECQRLSQISGILKEKKEKHFLETYGVDNPFKDSGIKEQIKKTCTEKYGVDNPAKNKSVYKKVKETNLERYGTECARNNPDINNKIKKTNLERYGHESTFSVPCIQTKSKETLLERYGVDSNLKIPGFYVNVKQTMLSRYGVEVPFQLPHVIAKSHSPEAKRKAWETIKAHGMMKISKVERLFSEKLIDWFGPHSIETQKILNNIWPIDMYIKHLDLYVQFDGIYWHGLDRQIDIIKASTTKRDQFIYKKFLRDLRQNEWCKQHNFKLIRVTDKQFKDNKYNIEFFLEEITRYNFHEQQKT